MPALDFPSAPVTGQTFTSGTITWQYDGARWIILSPHGLTEAPVNGSRYLRKDGGWEAEGSILRSQVSGSFDCTTTPTVIPLGLPSGITRFNLVNITPLSAANNRLYIDSYGLGDWNGDTGAFITMRTAHNSAPRGGQVRFWYHA